jgi:hypothetical protein
MNKDYIKHILEKQIVVTISTGNEKLKTKFFVCHIEQYDCKGILIHDIKNKRHFIEYSCITMIDEKKNI